MNYISLKGWEKFQHYKDRDPPWVKLYRDLLTTESWVLGTDTSRLVQVASILLAARYINRIPYRWGLIKKVASLDCAEKQFDEAIRHLADTGFLEIQQVEESASAALATCATTSSAVYSETEQSRAEGEQSRDRNVAQRRDDGPVERVFEHWRAEYRHPKASLDPKRRKTIQRALQAYDEPTLCQAISGYKLSPHHMGQNDQRTVYDDISLFLRDAEHIDRGLAFARAPPQAAKSAVELAREKLRGVNGNGRVVEQSGSSDGSMGSAIGLLRGGTSA